MPGAGAAASEPLKGLGGSGASSHIGGALGAAAAWVGHAMGGSAGAAAAWAGHAAPHLPWTAPGGPWMSGGARSGGRGKAGKGLGRGRGSGRGHVGAASSWREDEGEDADLQEALKRSMSEQ